MLMGFHRLFSKMSLFQFYYQFNIYLTDLWRLALYLYNLNKQKLSLSLKVGIQEM